MKWPRLTCSGATTGDACQSGEVCVSGEACNLGSCEVDCPVAQIACGASCVDPDNDPVFCGASSDCGGANDGDTCAAGTACSTGACAGANDGVTFGAGTACVDGACEASCASPLEVCDASCVDTRTQPCVLLTTLPPEDEDPVLSRCAVVLTRAASGALTLSGEVTLRLTSGTGASTVWTLDAHVPPLLTRINFVGIWPENPMRFEPFVLSANSPIYDEANGTITIAASRVGPEHNESLTWTFPRPGVGQMVTLTCVTIATGPVYSLTGPPTPGATDYVGVWLNLTSSDESTLPRCSVQLSQSEAIPLWFFGNARFKRLVDGPAAPSIESIFEGMVMETPSAN